MNSSVHTNPHSCCRVSLRECTTVIHRTILFAHKYTHTSWIANFIMKWTAKFSAIVKLITICRVAAKIMREKSGRSSRQATLSRASQDGLLQYCSTHCSTVQYHCYAINCENQYQEVGVSLETRPNDKALEPDHRGGGNTVAALGWPWYKGPAAATLPSQISGNHTEYKGGGNKLLGRNL